MESKKKDSRMLGKIAYVKDKESIYYGEWGVVDYYDGDCYHLRIANGSGAMPMFDRDQLWVPRQQQAVSERLRGGGK